MCGIYAEYAVSDRHINSIKVENIVNGLKLVENRGYDSCGLFLSDKCGKYLIKKSMNLNEIHENLKAFKSREFKFGMGHTRWCTNGVPSSKNSHPHTSSLNNKQKVTVVHNGILENIDEIYEFISRNFPLFTRNSCISDTDTEIIANYFSCCISYFNSSNLDFLEILSAIFENSKIPKIKGFNTILIYYNNRVFVYKDTNSLIFGYDEKEKTIKISSQITRLMEISCKTLYLFSDGVHEINRNLIYNPNILNKNTILTSEKKNHETEKNTEKFSSVMLKEIYDQAYLSNIGCVEIIGDKIMNMFCNMKNIVLVGCGSSYNACKLIKKNINKKFHLSKNVYAFDSCNLTKYDIPKHVIDNASDTLVFFISQSGETIDTYKAISLFKDFVNTVGITNCEHSLIYRNVTHNVVMNIGEEIAVASTKSFTRSVNIFNNLISQKKPIPDRSKLYDILCQLELNVDNFLNDKMQNFSLDFTKVNIMFLMGDSEYFHIAEEGSLKIKEISYINAQAYPLSGLKHGPFALLTDSSIVILIESNDGLNRKKIETVYNEVLCRVKNSFNILIIRENEGLLTNISSSNLYQEIVIILLQILSVKLGMLKKINVDRPRNLAKSVTVI